MALILLVGCNNPEKKTINYYDLPAYNQKQNLQAVIEIPAGTNKKIEYQKETNSFLTDSIKNKPRSIDFLPYPGNYGFIPGTYSNPEKGGDGDALDVLILSENTATASIVEVKPIAVVRLRDNGEADSKIIAVPLDKNQRILNINNFEELSLQYPQIRKSLSIWFQNYDKKDNIKIRSWGGEEAATKLIQQWRVK